MVHDCYINVYNRVYIILLTINVYNDLYLYYHITILHHLTIVYTSTSIVFTTIVTVTPHHIYLQVSAAPAAPCASAAWPPPAKAPRSSGPPAATAQWLPPKCWEPAVGKVGFDQEKW